MTRTVKGALGIQRPELAQLSPSHTATTSAAGFSLFHLYLFALLYPLILPGICEHDHTHNRTMATPRCQTERYVNVASMSASEIARIEFPQAQDESGTTVIAGIPSIAQTSIASNPFVGMPTVLSRILTSADVRMLFIIIRP